MWISRVTSQTHASSCFWILMACISLLWKSSNVNLPNLSHFKGSFPVNFFNLPAQYAGKSFRKATRKTRHSSRWLSCFASESKSVISLEWGLNNLCSCSVHSTTLWVKYALIKGDNTLLYANSVGSVLTLIYVIIYYIYTMHRVSGFLNSVFHGTLPYLEFCIFILMRTSVNQALVELEIILGHVQILIWAHEGITNAISYYPLARIPNLKVNM